MTNYFDISAEDVISASQQRRIIKILREFCNRRSILEKMDTADTTTATAKRIYRVTAQQLEGTSGDNLDHLPYSELGQLVQVAQYCVLSGFGWRSYNFSGQPVPLFNQPQRKKRSFLLVLKWNFLHFCLWLLPLVHPWGTNEQSLSPPPLLLPTSYLYTLVRYP